MESLKAKNRLVNTQTGENYSNEAFGVWEYALENGEIVPVNLTGKELEGYGISPSEDCQDLQEFEEELSERFGTELSFSGLSEEERKTQDNWIKLKAAVLYGNIVHVEKSEEEFLNHKDFWAYIGTGKTGDWENDDAVEIEEEGEYPDSVGGFSISKLYKQKNTLVNSPLNDFPGWEDEWEITDTIIRYKNSR